MNKPVNCGCGGKVEVDTKLVSCAPVERKRVYCSKCYISTEWMESEAEAIEVWNTAMSGVVYPCTTPNGVYTGGCTITNTTDDKDDFHPVYDCMVGKERTAKVIKGSNNMITVAACGDCGTVVNIFDKYCARCGARLEWE